MMKFIAKNDDCLHEFDHSLKNKEISLVKRVLKFSISKKKIELIKLLLEQYHLKKSETKKDTFDTIKAQNKIKEKLFTKLAELNKKKLKEI